MARGHHDLLGMADQDGDNGFILWGRIGDSDGLHAHPHSPNLKKKKRKNKKVERRLKKFKEIQRL